MSVAAQGAQETVSRSKVIELIQSLGLDPNRIYSLTFMPHGIYAEIPAEDSEGHTVVSDNWDGQHSVMRHRIYIRVAEDQ